ncbi:MAG: putative Ig domain-containing protein [Streptosporangiaceae bacterium]
MASTVHQPAPRPARVQAGVGGRSRIAPEGLAHHSTQSGRHAGKHVQRQPDMLPPPDGSDLGDPLPLGDLALGTYVTNQFAKDGIIFSGQSPFITDDGSSDVNPTLSGSPLFQGTIVGTFVKPGTNKPATVDDFSVEVGYIDNPGSTQMTVYNSKGQQLGVLVATEYGFNQLYSTFPNAASFSVSSVANEPAGWELNTIQIGPIDTNYIAMGDSYSSGEGTYDFPWSQAQGTQCDTGPLAWPVQMADNENANSTGATLNIDQDSLVACQGERTYQLSQPVNGESASELDQVTNYVSQNGPPDLVTITIGGNDLGFADVLKSCFLGGTEYCLHVISGLNSKVTTGAAGLIATLASTYQQVVSAADSGSGDDDGDGPQVVVVGYPNLFPQPGGLGTALSVTYHCPWLRETLFPLLPIVSPFVNTLLSNISNAQAALNDDIAAAAAEAGVQFVPIPYSVSGHELCTGTPYINPLSLIGGITGNRNLGHPNVAGSAAIANAVGGALGLATAGPNQPAKPQARVRPMPRTHRVSGPTRPGIRPPDSGPLSFSGGQLQDGTVGSDYIDYLVATGGNGADTWSVTSGSLPPGLSLDANAGTITGTATTSGDYTFTAQVTDSSNPPQTASAQVTIDVDAATTLSVGSGTPPDATAGQPYSFQLQGGGGLGQLTWKISSGKLPAGLHLNTTAGQLYGTPATSAVGTASFTVQATDSSSPAQVATASESITVHPASDPLTVTSTTLPELTAGQDYGAQLTSTGGVAPVTWSVSSGSLPPGLSLDPGTGLVTGAATAAGTYDFTAAATDGSAPVSQTATASLAITIDAPPALGITTTGAFDGTEGSYYSSTFQATGGVGSYNWYISSGSLPDGLSLDGSTGQVTGTPTGTGNSTFDVTVSDAAGDTATQSYSVGIAQVPLTVSSTIAPATVGTYYTGNVTPSGGEAPYGYSLVSGTLPDGLTFDPSTGAITGTATQSGSFPLQVSVADSAEPSQQVTANVTLTVAAAPTLTVSTDTPVHGAVGDFYTTGIGYSGGVGPYTWSVTSGSLPAGLTLDPGSGMVVGTPTTAGSGKVTIQVTDSSTPAPEVASATLTFTIVKALALKIAEPALPLATQGVSYSGTLQASGGVPAYTWSLASGTLPAGLYLESYNGEIYGTPTGSGTKTFTVEVTDSESTPVTVKHKVTLTVNKAAPVSITSTTLDDATQGSTYDAPLTAAGGTSPYTWSVEAGRGTLPAGLELYSDGYITGTPTHFGTSTFTVEATDSSTPTPKVAKEALTLDVDALPKASPQFTEDYPTSQSAVGDYYGYQFQASGNPTPTYRVSSGRLPAGLTLSKQGLLSGTTTKVGTFTFEVTASNGRTPAVVTPELQIEVLPPPVISAFTPTSGIPGTKVVITGKNLENAYYAYFDGSYATIQSATYSKIVTSVPEYAGTGPIYVYTPGGEVASSNSFTVDPAPAPTIKTISPTKGAPGNTLHIYGTGLEFATYVEFGGGVYEYSLYTDTPGELTLPVPDGVSAGPVTVYTNGGTVTSTQTFTPTGGGGGD